MEPSSAVAPSYTPDLRVGHIFSRAWDVYKSNLGLILGSALIYMLLAAILSGGETWGLSPALGNVVWLVVAGPLTVGLYGILLRLIRGEEASISDLFDGFQHFGRAFGVYVLMAVAIMVGFILLIIPGIIVAVGLLPAMYLVYDEDRGVVETLQRAWDLTKGHKLELFVLGVVLIFLVLAGLLGFVIGVFFTAAFAMTAWSVAYDELSLGAA